MPVERVVFICAGNICRSAVAEHLFRVLAPASPRAAAVAVTSAGLDAIPGDAPSPGTRRAALVQGVDVSAHRARRLERGFLRPGDLALAMERMQVERVREMVVGLKELASPLAPTAAHLMIDAHPPAHPLLPEVRLLGSYAPGPEEITDPGGLEDHFYDECLGRIRVCVEALIRGI